MNSNQLEEFHIFWDFQWNPEYIKKLTCCTWLAIFLLNLESKSTFDSRRLNEVYGHWPRILHQWRISVQLVWVWVYMKKIVLADSCSTVWGNVFFSLSLSPSLSLLFVFTRRSCLYWDVLIWMTGYRISSLILILGNATNSMNDLFGRDLRRLVSVRPTSQ